MKPLELIPNRFDAINKPPVEYGALVVVHRYQTETGTNCRRVIAGFLDGLDRIGWQFELPKLRDVLVKPARRQRRLTDIGRCKADEVISVTSPTKIGPIKLLTYSALHGFPKLETSEYRRTPDSSGYKPYQFRISCPRR